MVTATGMGTRIGRIAQLIAGEAGAGCAWRGRVAVAGGLKSVVNEWKKLMSE